MTALEIDLPTDTTVRMRRSFAAGPDLVFDAHTVPALLRRWYGPPGWEMTVCEIDLRTGGKYRFVTRQPSGRAIGQYGSYREVIRPLRVIHTERWEDWDPGEVVVTTSFEAEGEGTLLTVSSAFPSKEVRDQLIDAGMTDGAEDAYRKLDVLLEAERR
jgi:uncharacterized protein YndB with AHSA1/START domain